jgi:hypothetical protein
VVDIKVKNKTDVNTKSNKEPQCECKNNVSSQDKRKCLDNPNEMHENELKVYFEA